MTDTDDAPRIPFDGERPLRPSPLLTELRRAAPVVRVRTPAGDPAWLVTRYDAARALWADPRLGTSHPAPETASRISTSGVFTGPFGNHETEHSDHAMVRALLAPSFAARRVARLEDHVAAVVHDAVEGMAAERAATGAPVDLHAHLSVPVPLRVVATVLGVPSEDHAEFGALTDRVLGTSGAEPQRAMARMRRYCLALAQRKRAEPGDDVVSDLVAAQHRHPDLTDSMIVEMTAQILMAGYDTVVGRIDSGVLLLAEHPDVYAALSRGGADVDPVVEEVLRRTMIDSMGMPRYAHDDVVVGRGDEAVTIPAGDAVLLSMGAANHDDRAFAAPEDFDPSRPGVPHLSFGHGPHFCIGAALARLELREVFTTLAARMPGLRPAVALDELPVRADHLTSGLAALPIVW